MVSAASVIEYARSLSALSVVGPTPGGALIIDSQAVGDHEYCVRAPGTVDSFVDSDWFSTTADSLSSWLIVQGDLTIGAGVTIIPPTRKLFTVLYVAGNLHLDGNISMTARGANHGPFGSSITEVPILVETGTAIPAAGGAGAVGAVADTGHGGNGGSGVPLSSSGGGGAGGSRYNASYGGRRAGSGAAGTSFSGGPGGGGSRANGYPNITAVDAGIQGGQGGTGAGDGYLSLRAGGGAGNPPYNDGGWAVTGGVGTGGTLIILVEGAVSGSGTASANGVAGGNSTGDTAGGGGSGGGIVLVMSGAGTPDMEADGGSSGSGGSGTSGGVGGAGYIGRTQLVAPDVTITDAPIVSLDFASVTWIRADWSFALGATSYDVRIDGGAPITGVTELTYTFDGLVAGTAHVIEVRGVNAHGAGPWGSLAASTISSLYQDSFDRANSATALGTPEFGGPYTVRTGTWGINGNSLYTSVSTAESQVTFPAAIDVDFSVVVGTFGPNAGLMFRWLDANNFWLLQVTSAGMLLYRRQAGTYYQQGATYVAPRIPGDTIRAVAIGARIQIYYNDNLIIDQDDPYYAQAAAVCGYRFSTDTSSRFASAQINEPAALPDRTGSLFAFAMAAIDVDLPDALLYKGRDTKTADEGAVA